MILSNKVYGNDCSDLDQGIRVCWESSVFRKHSCLKGLRFRVSACHNTLNSVSASVCHCVAMERRGYSMFTDYHYKALLLAKSFSS